MAAYWVGHDLSAICVISETDAATAFPITDTKPYAPVVTWSTQDTTKLVIHTISKRFYQSKSSTLGIN